MTEARQNQKQSSSDAVSDGTYDFAVSLMVQLIVPAFVLNVQGRVVIWNRACEHLTGVAAEEVVGTSDHWRAFYRKQRPTLADMILNNRIDDAKALYSIHSVSSGEDPNDRRQDMLSAAGWCEMPRAGGRRYLIIDAGPIYNKAGELFGVLETWRDMTVQKEAQLALESLVMRDGLTGIANRRCFDQTLLNEWAHTSREGQPLSLLLVDVDHFKRYNDTFGHPEGDECLKRVAAALSSQVRTYDLVARYGGEEFAIILPNQTLSDAATVAERVRAAVEQNSSADLGSAGGQTTVSIGVAACMARQLTSPEQLLAEADAALYRSKRDGRNRVTLHE